MKDGPIIAIAELDGLDHRYELRHDMKADGLLANDRLQSRIDNVHARIVQLRFHVIEFDDNVFLRTRLQFARLHGWNIGCDGESLFQV